MGIKNIKEEDFKDNETLETFKKQVTGNTSYHH
jgi:hypothetical protein